MRRRDDELVRLAKRPDGSLVLGRCPGRGAWVCPDEACLARLKTTSLARAWRRDVDDEDLAEVRRRVGAQIPGSVKE